LSNRAWQWRVFWPILESPPGAIPSALDDEALLLEVSAHAIAKIAL
jgi:hypothetical protein